MAQPSDDLAVELRTALATEGTTVQRYSYFSQVAEIEGHAEIAQAFSDLAESIACAAHGHIDALQGIADRHTRQTIGDTRLNLAASVADALHVANEVYPRLAARAHETGHADVASWLTTLGSLKRSHLTKFQVLLTALDAPSPAARAAATEGDSDD
ncbi:rubrerythrin family protein [Streptomyces sp. NPDC028722]|uniref:rubrerythrin family protein n=1 Tax=Streptomyces sp. NPDC028722 TaxID=3155016 RepID=UPI0033D9F417